VRYSKYRVGLPQITPQSARAYRSSAAQERMASVEAPPPGEDRIRIDVQLEAVAQTELEFRRHPDPVVGIVPLLVETDVQPLLELDFAGVDLQIDAGRRRGPMKRPHRTPVVADRKLVLELAGPDFDDLGLIVLLLVCSSPEPPAHPCHRGD
jgi:hypothetical protein